jgi:hypothetical protein
MSAKFRLLNLIMVLAMVTGLVFTASSPVFADDTAQSLPFTQAWTDTGLITTNDVWSGVPGIVGYRGDDLTTATGTNPQTLLADSSVVDVNANQTNPVSFTTGGVTEFHLTNPVVALAGSGTADAPYVLFNLTTVGKASINVAYNVRDIEAGTDSAIQQVALHYRVGNSGTWTDLPAGYIADATTGTTDTQVTPISVTLPAAANNKSLVQVRVMTTNAAGNDEWVGIDDISVTGIVLDPAPTVVSTTPANSATGVALDTNIGITFSEPVTLATDFASISCGTSGTHTYSVNESADPVIELNPDGSFSYSETCTVTITASLVTDDDTNDPLDAMESNYSWSFTTIDIDPAPTVILTDPDTDVTGVALDAEIAITFSEPVALGSDFAAITCGNSGLHTYSVDESADPLIVLTPDSPFLGYETCTVTVTASLVTDEDTNDPWDTMISDYSWSFTTVAADEAAALALVQDQTTLTGDLDALTATFPASIPQVLVDLPYQINSRMTLGQALPAGTTVSILATVDGVGPFPYVTDALIPGTTFWITELFDPDGTPADFDTGYGGHVEIYNITITSGGGNPLEIDTTVLIESIISKDGFSTNVVLDDISLPVVIAADEDAALAYVQANTTLTGTTLDELTATFPASIPPVLVDLPYQINTRLTLSEALPVGTTITILATIDGAGPFPYVTDAPVPGSDNVFWITELFEPDATPADFDAGYGGHVEIYNVTVTSGGGDPWTIGTTVLIESIISKDGFSTNVVLDDIDLPVFEDSSLAYVVDQTTLTGTLAALTATFPAGIPPAIVDLPYQINSRMTLADALPVGTTVTILATFDGSGPFPYITNALIPGTTFWITDLAGGTPADFDAGYGGHVEIYSISINTGGVAVDTSVLIESIISKDDFVTPVVLADISLPIVIDAAPSVTGVTPLNGATGVALDANLTVTFSEAVDVASGWYAISCARSGTHTALISGGPSVFTLDPDADFLPFEVCSTTIENTLVTDQDTVDPLDAMLADYSWSFTTFYDSDSVLPIAVARAAGANWIGTIQGNVTLTPGVHASNSFSIQDATGGIYIYPAFGYVVPTMALGDVVRVKGTIVAYHGLLEVSSIQSVSWISTGTVPAPLVTATNSVAATQGKLIQVQGTATWTGTPPAPGTNTNFTIRVDDGSGQVAVYVYKLTNIDLRSFVSGQQMRIIGISDSYDAPQVKPRYQSDIIDLRPATVTGTDPANLDTGVSPHRPVSATFSKSMDPASLDGHFTIAGVSGSVTYTETTHTAVFTPAGPLAGNTLYTATLSTGVTDSYGVPLADPYSWSFTTGEQDTTAPSIMTRSPLPAALDVPVSSPITVTFDEDLAPSSLDLAHFIPTSSYGTVPVTFNYNPATFTVTLTPTVSLLYNTLYTMTVTANTADYAGNDLGTDAVWTFTTIAEPPMQTYYGDLHNHTSYSDGSGTPSLALAAGEAAGFDFMAISDHSYAIDDAEWANTLTAVNAATDADFVALRGFEYTQGAEGHINVWNSTRHACRANTGYSMCDYTPNLEAGVTVQGFYPWLVSAVNTPLDAAGEVMQFNHPGWINFNDWFFHPEVSGIARLEEVGNGNGTSYVFSEGEYLRSLDYGWKLGATNNADTHSLYWGTNTDDRTGVVMPELTKTALLEALRLRRTFATEDKNYNLTMKANGAWMGSEIANTGTLAFEITGSDPDFEQSSRVQLITDQGAVAALYVPITTTFTWEPVLPITPGVHYYYVKVTQADGDRIVTSPVWTMGSEDVSVTDLTIQPTIPTTHNPSLLTVRVTNRIVPDNRIVHVILKVDDVQQGSAIEVTVPANGDGYANFSWQPTATGDVTITAEITDAPAGDNPDDNSISLDLNVTDELLPLILVDAGHGNENATGNEMKPFIEDLSAHGYNVLKNLDALTDADLDNAVVKLLIITAPQTAYTPAEIASIASYVQDGGSLWMGGLADYNASLPWAATVANRENDILDAIETTTGQDVNMRMNDDEVIDGNTNNGYVFGVVWQDFPSAETTGIGMNVVSVASWSLASIVDGNKQALTSDDLGVSIVMQGDLDEGYTSDSWHNPFHTSNTDYDAMGDAFIYNPTWVYPATKPAGAIPLPGAAVVQLSGGAGRIMLYGDSNDPFTIFSYTAGDGRQNELFNLQSMMWLLGEPLEKSTIAEARAQATPDHPDNLDKVVWVEGEITAAYGEFFNVLYVQDDTGGITVHAPAGDIDPAAFTRGTHIRAIGTVGIYQGDTEIEFFEAEQVQVIPPTAYDATPLALTTAAASLESNEGWLTSVTGTVMSKSGTDTIIVDDGSGPVRVFLDGYNGSLEDIQVMDQVQVTGLASEDGSGGRIRVRNHNFHIGIDDDVILLEPAKFVFLGQIYKKTTP